jgi:S-methylmethionine-dependent homocysteine/selenocysteine methylase/SAM-dependent methyltransferase
MADGHSKAYQQIMQKLAEDQPVILDGGGATELQRLDLKDFYLSDKSLWGTWSLYNAPYAALEVHRRYLAAGCDILSTHTWAITSAPEAESRGPTNGTSHWMDIARLGIRLARQAIAEVGKTDECVVAFSLNGDVDSPRQQDTLQLLARVFEEEPPDLILLETLSLIRENSTYPAVETMLQTGIPVWLSFRRCRHGVCGVYGQHWGGPEGDLFGRAARKFEEMGVGALMINCLPVSHVSGMLPWLRDFTDMPLGVYPNLGHYLDPGWKFDEKIGPDDYAELAWQWRKEGAQIVGGCCGVTPEHIAATREKLAGTKPGHPPATPSAILPTPAPSAEKESVARPLRPWTDEQGRVLYPLAFPEITCEPGVFRPTQGSFLLWKYLFRFGIGAGKQCLDVGCGTGILTTQLALNGAQHVHAIDVQPKAVENTLANAFRNGVADRVSGAAIDLYAYLPDQRYDVIVASLYQMPVDPTGEITGHRPVDFWGRNMLDHLISLLPDMLAADGVAYVMQISILSQLRTETLLAEAGLESKVVDFAFFHFSPVFYENIEQIHRVEQLSDAYHLTFGEDDVMVMYLLEVTPRTPAVINDSE